MGIGIVCQLFISGCLSGLMNGLGVVVFQWFYWWDICEW
jgi:hypothetical protein